MGCDVDCKYICLLFGIFGRGYREIIVCEGIKDVLGCLREMGCYYFFGNVFKKLIKVGVMVCLKSIDYSLYVFDFVVMIIIF